MYARIGYRYDPELKVNRITHYIILKSDVLPELNKDEILVPYDQLPPDFDYKYSECEVVDGKVQWSYTLYHHFHCRHV